MQSLQMSKPSLLKVWGDCSGGGGLQWAGRQGHPGDLLGPAELNPSVLADEAFWPTRPLVLNGEIETFRKCL